ncbi:MAG: fluoride efflux transporter CrcB [Eggerthellales bacterium]|nr:fluoride efflux transporter CrcB [Eggerthellales bacterium]
MVVQCMIVGLGASIGAIGRYLIGVAVTKLSPEDFLGGFPLGTALANVIGSFAIGFLSVIFEQMGEKGSSWRLFSITGLLGGFTTFSTFSLETVALWQSQAFGLAVVNAVLSLGLCILGVIAGRFLGHMVYAS